MPLERLHTPREPRRRGRTRTMNEHCAITIPYSSLGLPIETWVTKNSLCLVIRLTDMPQLWMGLSCLPARHHILASCAMSGTVSGNLPLRDLLRTMAATVCSSFAWHPTITREITPHYVLDVRHAVSCVILSMGALPPVTNEDGDDLPSARPRHCRVNVNMGQFDECN